MKNYIKRNKPKEKSFKLFTIASTESEKKEKSTHLKSRTKKNTFSLFYRQKIIFPLSSNKCFNKSEFLFLSLECSVKKIESKTLGA